MDYNTYEKKMAFNLNFKHNYTQIKNEITSLIDLMKSDITYFKIAPAISEKLMNSDKKNVQLLGLKILKEVEKYKKEINRVTKMYEFDKNYKDYNSIAGVDEVGRGPFAGPIVASAVVINLDYNTDKDLILYINDSKKLTKKIREDLSSEIKSKAISYSYALIDNNRIDECGIGWCNNEVFKISTSLLKIRPDLILSDGYKIKDINIANEYVIKGDTKSANIACASIIAKVYRDNLMCEYANTYPEYGFERNAGYGTSEHIEAIKKYGITPIHRKSFIHFI